MAVWAGTGGTCAGTLPMAAPGCTAGRGPFAAAGKAGEATAAGEVTAAGGAGAVGGAGEAPLLEPSNALVAILRALGTPLGITHTVLPSPCASCGSVCRYW